MDSRGNILDMAKEMVRMLSEPEREKLVPIPPEQEAAVRGMNRKARRTWYAQQRSKKGKAP